MIGEAPRRSDQESGELEIFLVAAEESGDRLGAALMRALRQRSTEPLRFSGVGGRQMAAAGLVSLLPMDDFAIIGFFRHSGPTAADCEPHVPGGSRRSGEAAACTGHHRQPGLYAAVARFVRWFDRSIPIIDYVSPSVWAWRAGRAPAMRRYVDHVLALLPFEPDVHRRLGGPPCSYVGHPLIEEVAKLRPNGIEVERRMADPPIVLAMPGSRSSEIARLAGIFGDTLALVAARAGSIEVVVPTVPHLLAQVTQATSRWPIKTRIVVEQAEKHAALRVARAALAKSGTTTLELAVAGVPMVAAYKVAPLEAAVIRRLVRVPSYILANLVIGRNVVPELVQEDCTAERLAETLAPLLGDTPERHRQVEAFATLDAIMEIGSRAPAARAADIVLGHLRRDGGAMAAGNATG